MKTKDEAFELAIHSFSDNIKQIARAIRQLIYQVYPDVVEVVWIKQKNSGYGSGPKKNTDHFCYVMPATKHVNLGFNYGAKLPDPANLLEGTGKLFRHIKIKSVEQLKDENLLTLLTYAISFRIPSTHK